MKFKKYFVLIITILLALCLVGCGEANTEKAVANNIEKNTAKLDSIIQRLDEINYDDIIIQDISPFSSGRTSTISNVNNLEKTKYYSVGRGETKPYQPSSLVTNTSKDNAKFVSADKIDIDKNSTTYNKNTLRNNINKNYSTKRLTSKNCENGNCQENYTASRTSTYTPRYVNEISSSFSRNGLDNYLNQIEIVYNTCADCIGCSAECKNETARIKQNINECKVLGGKLKDGSIKLSEAEIDSCNDCLNDLQACSYKLNLTKDNITIKEKDVTKLKDNLSKNLSQLQEAYSKLLAALESRLDYLKSCDNCITSLCDIINKTNVNMVEAEKNKSNKEDIILSEDKLKNEQENNKTYEEGILDTTKNTTASNTAKKSSTNTQNKSYSTKKLNTTKNTQNITQKNTSNNSNNSKNNINPYKKIVENRNVKSGSNQTQNTSNKTNINSTNINSNKKYRDNIQRTPNTNENANNSNEKTNKAQNYQSKIDKDNEQTTQQNINESNLYTKSVPNSNNENQQNLNNNQNLPNSNTSQNMTGLNAQNVPSNGNLNNFPNVNNVPNTAPVNPYIQNGYNNGYPYGYGYGNRPYPPRNIDTYRTIIKNIDTYSPNYVPGNGMSGYNTQPFAYNNQNLNDSQNKTTENTETQETNDENTQNILPGETNNQSVQNKSVLKNDNENLKIKSDAKNDVTTENNTTMQSAMQNKKLLENTDKNTTMQEQNTNNKIGLLPDEDVSEVKEMVNELY